MHPHLLEHVRQAYLFSSLRVLRRLGGHSAVNVLCEGDGRQVVVKIFSAPLAPRASKCAKVLRSLADAGAPTSVVLRASDGRDVVTTAGQSILVLLYAPGRVLHREQLSEAALGQACRALAHLHALPWEPLAQAGVVAPMSLQSWRERPSPGRIVVGRGGRCSAEAAALVASSIEAKADAHASLNWQALALENQEVVLCHGDLHNENIVFSEGGHDVCILDLEDAALGPGSIDLTNLMLFICADGAYERWSFELAHSMIRNYQKVRPMPPAALIFGIEYFFLRLTSSLFFEQKVLDGDDSAAAFIRRDLARIRVLESHRDKVVEQICSVGPFFDRHARWNEKL